MGPSSRSASTVRCVSVTTYRDAGFLPQAFVNFVACWVGRPRTIASRCLSQELIDVFSLEGMNRGQCGGEFQDPAPTPEETFDPKAVWLNAEHIRSLPVEDLSARLLPVVRQAGHNVDEAQMPKITPLIRERIKLLKDVLVAADFC